MQPKWQFVDPSLATAALRAQPEALLDDLDTFGLLFESLAIRDLRIYAQPLGGTLYHYRDDSGLEVDAIVELGDGRWSAFEVKLGGTGNIEKAASSLRALKARVSEQRARQLSTLNVVTAGAESYTRPDGVSANRALRPRVRARPVPTDHADPGTPPNPCTTGPHGPRRPGIEASGARAGSASRLPRATPSASAPGTPKGQAARPHYDDGRSLSRGSPPSHQDVK